MSEPIRREVPPSQVAEILTQKLQQGGVFLSTCLDPARPNTMTLGWGGIGCLFNKPMFCAPVRASRHSFSLLRQSNVFTISVPLHDMKAELAFAGTQSGREVHKFESHGLTPAPAMDVPVPIVEECELHLECRVVASPALGQQTVAEAPLQRWYGDGDMHTMFFAEILHCYYTK